VPQTPTEENEYRAEYGAAGYSGKKDRSRFRQDRRKDPGAGDHAKSAQA
jgi:hypothetical protein